MTAARGAPAPIRRLLFVELLGGLGDVAEAMPAIQALARSHPRAHVEVLCFAPGAELLRHDPHVDAVRVAHEGMARDGVAAALVAGPWDLVVSTTDYDGIGALIAGRAAAGARAVTDLWRDPPPNERAGVRFVRLLVEDGFVRPDAALPARLFLAPDERARAAREVPDGGGRAAALILDAGMAIKRWPEARFAALGRALRDRHGLRPLVVGGADETAAPRVAAAIGHGARGLDPMGLRDLGAVLERCAVAVGGDTGPLRLAALAGTPSAMLFGPSPSGRYGLGPGHAALQACPDCPERRADVPAQRCWYAGACPLPRGPGSCTHEIDAAAVEAAVARLVAARARGTARAAGRSADRAAGWATDWVADWAKARRILVLRLDNIGDVLMTGPALEAIRASRPGARVGLLASPSGVQAAPLLPWIDEAHAVRALWQRVGPPGSRDGPASDEAMIEGLRRGRWDGAIVLTSFSQSPHPAALACRRAGIPLVAGASDEAGGALTHRLPKGDGRTHQAERNLALVRALGFEAGDGAMRLAVPDRARASMRAAAATRRRGGLLLVSPWASAQARQYDPRRMAEAAARIAAAHDLQAVVTGAPADAARGRTLAAAVPGARDLTGRTGVPDLAALVGMARLVLCCNSGAMHMAEALGTPAVILFAGTELPSQWAPRRTACALVARAVPCAPCHAFACPEGHHACLDVEACAVAAAADALLGRATERVAS